MGLYCAWQGTFWCVWRASVAWPVPSHPCCDHGPVWFSTSPNTLPIFALTDLTVFFGVLVGTVVRAPCQAWQGWKFAML